MRPTQDDFDQIVAMLVQEGGLEVDTDPPPFEPGQKGPAKPKKDWVPLHGPTQTIIFNDRADVVGACGEKFTGKSIVFCDCLVAHCHEEHDALAVVMGNSHRALAEGICHDLMTFTLPRWRDGNRFPLFDAKTMQPHPRAGELMDHGIGLEYTSFKADPNNKDLYIKIRNRFGGWSRIRVLAIPNGVMVQSRVTNLNASMFYLEEATRCDTDDYYKWPSLQLNRRRGINGTQQFAFSCNPDDPKHWVHDLAYRDCVVGKNEPGRVWANDPEQPGIRRDPAISFHYLNYKENQHNVTQKNRETLKRTLRSDPVMRQRLMESKWVAMPIGDALFKTQFSEERHVVGDVEKRRGLVPVVGYPIEVGLDWGSRSIGIVFRQLIETQEGTAGLTIDSISYHMEMHKTKRLAVAILEKMRYWTDWLRGEKDNEDAAWSWWFLAGDDATTNYNPGTGSINARDLEDKMQEAIDDDPFRYRGLEAPRINGVARPKGSKEKRVDIVAEALMEDREQISALAEDVIGMMLNLPKNPKEPGEAAGKNRWIHIFDAYSYIAYYRRFQLGPEGFTNFDAGDAVSVA